jgi:hypothetical protein
VTAIDKADRLTNLISMKSARQLLLWCLLLTALAAISTYWAVVNEPMRGEGFEIRDLPTRSAAPQVMAKSANGSAVTVNAEVTTNPTHPTVTRQGPMDGEGSSLRKSGTAQPNNNGTPRQYNNGVARQNYINPGPVVAWDKAAGTGIIIRRWKRRRMLPGRRRTSGPRTMADIWRPSRRRRKMILCSS